MLNDLLNVRELFQKNQKRDVVQGGLPKAMIDSLLRATRKANQLNDKEIFYALLRAIDLLDMACDAVDSGQRSFVAEIGFLAEIDRVISALENVPLIKSAISGQQEDVVSARIVKGKEFWVFHYKGGKASVDSNLIGLKFLEMLLRNRYKAFTYKDMRIKAGTIGEEEGAYRPIDQIERETIDNLTPEKIDDALSTIEDPVERAEEKEKIEETLRNSKDIKGRIKNSDFKHYKSVREAIEVVYKRIESQCEPLHSHLRQWIVEYSRYSPDSEIIWEFE